MEPLASEYLWIVVVGFVVSFLLGFAIGANDVANSFGTSVGSGVLTFRQACILATICETSGSVLLGYKVADTIRKNILDISVFEGVEEELMLGMLSTLFGSAVWMFIATYFKLPVSTTHSMVGSTVGFALVSKGTQGIRFEVLGPIAASWFISPFLSGLTSVVLLSLIKGLIVHSEKPFQRCLIALPIIYGSTIFVNIFSVMLNGSKLLGMENVELWLSATVSIATGLIVGVFCQFIIVPWMKRRIESSVNHKNNTLTRSPIATSTATVMTIMTASSPSINDAGETGKKEEHLKGSDDEANKVNKLFHSLQTLTAMFSSFAHGGNDVSNAIAPMIAIWMIFHEGTALQKSESPLYMLIYGGVGMSLGMWMFGKRVNQTIGKNLTKIVPMTGFTVEFSSAITVLTASKLGIPISSTHCIVGSIVFLGWAYGEREMSGNSKKVDWSLFRTIIYAWLVTLPASGLASALLMAILKYTVLAH